jgi:hypothetical protein
LDHIRRVGRREPPQFAFGAGDYDHDGHSEVLFMKSSYDRDGYVLFSDNFEHSTEFSWAYQ